jgi:uncharacterized RDD family membrane protein YckC
VREIRTAEGLALTVALAGRGQRLMALILDLVIFTVLAAMALVAVVMVLRGPIGVATGAGIFTLGRTGYFLVFELGRQAATPGKRLVGIRVADRDGGRLGADAVVVRNLVREAELFLPLTLMLAGLIQGRLALLLTLAWALLPALLPLFNRDRLRGGDLAAGTWVIAVPDQPMLPPDLIPDGMPRAARFVFTPRQAAAYGIRELQMLEDLLRREAGDGSLHRDVAKRIARRIGWGKPVPEGEIRAFLGDYYEALRGRLEADLVMGRRRVDKNSPAG